MSTLSEVQIRDGFATDFVVAPRLLRAGSAQAAMVRLLPLYLAERELPSGIIRPGVTSEH